MAALASMLRSVGGARNRVSSHTLRRLADAESWYRSISPWLLVREEDAVLIAPPNRVYKLGGSALDLMRWLDAGASIRNLPGLDETRAAELLRFFEELRAVSEGRPPEGEGFGRVAYDFEFTRLPVLGEAALTYRCNERCRFCYASCGTAATAGAATCRTGSCSAPPVINPSAHPSADELPTEGWKQILRSFKHEAKIPFFSFTGGEPLLRDDLEELASYARTLGLRTNLITNGTLVTPARAASLKAAGIDTAQVSLESPIPQIHDALCGTAEAWTRTIAGIRALHAAGISVQTNSTLTAANRESLRDLPELLSSLGVMRFSLNLFIPAGRGWGADDLFVPYSEVGDVVDGVRHAAHAAGLTFFWYSPTPYCLYNPVARGLGNKSCAALDGLVHVNPRGEVLPCSSWPESLGSLPGRRFTDIWFSERAAYFKNKRFAPSVCTRCEAFVACQGACPLYWRYAGEGEIAQMAGQKGER